MIAVHENKRKTGAATVLLPEQLTIAGVTDLFASLKEALASGEAIEIDARLVAEVDTAGLQLLVVVWTSRNADAARCKWAGVSEALERTARLIGVHEVLRLPTGGAGSDVHAPA